MSNALPQMGNIHHLAFRCRDAEQTRVFYEDVLGMKLCAALAFDGLPGVRKDYPYMHLFFEMADGNYIAFFDVPSDATEDHFGLTSGMDQHFAMEVPTKADQEAIVARLKDNGVKAMGPIDHEFVHSVYFYDPNGINVEVTYKDHEHDQIMNHEAAVARDNLREWTKKTREMKADKGLKIS